MQKPKERMAIHSAPAWAKSVKACADQRRAKHFLELLAATSAATALKKCSGEQARILAALFSGSPALSDSLAAHPDWLDLVAPETLKFPRRKQGLQNEVNAGLKPLLEAADFAGALTAIRRFKQREMFRIGARDLARLATVAEIIGEISAVADVCLESVWSVCHRQLSARHGQPKHQDAEGRWQATAGCVLGLGKLGGQELNYSSDVDVMFVYSEEGNVSPAMTNHQFFNRLAEAFIAEVGRMTTDGMLYRIDLRLRPEGAAGPLRRSPAGF
jgi:glutamate-ammonia-ligase adenylyltransferase